MTTATGSIRIDVFANFAEFSKSFDKGSKDLKKFQRDFTKVAGDLTAIGSRISLGVTAPLLLIGRQFAKTSTEMQAEVAQLDASFGELTNELGRELLPIFHDIVGAVKEGVDWFAKLSPETKKTIAGALAFTAALGPLLFISGGVVKVFTVLTGGLGILSKALRVTVGATTAMTVGVAEAGVATGVMGDKAVDTASRIGVLAGKMTFLVGGLLALGPAANSAGKAVGDLFFDTNKENDAFLGVTAQIPKILGGMGLTAKQATEAVARLRIEQGKFTSDLPDVQAEIDRLRGEYDGMGSAADHANPLVKGLFDLFQSGANKVREASAGFQVYIDRLALLKEHQDYLKDHEADIRRLKEAIDPGGQALARYNEQLEIARQAGLNLHDVNEALAVQFYKAAEGTDLLGTKLNTLPPALRDLVKELERVDALNPIKDMLDLDTDTTEQFMKDLADHASDLGDSIMQDLDKQSEAADKALKSRQRDIEEISDSIADAALGTRSWNDAFRDLVSSMLRSKVITPFLDKAVGGILDGAFGSVGSIFGGARANGGPVQAGRSYVVGEREMEIFTPNQSGRITPGGGAGGGVTINVTTPDANSFRASRRQVALAAQRALMTS